MRRTEKEKSTPPGELLRQAENQLVSALCGIRENPDGWLPHTVYVEEDGDCPVYTMYRLLDIRKDGGCTLYNPQTGERFTSRHLREISIEWLATLWERYLELCPEGREDSATETRSDKRTDIRAFVWSCSLAGRDMPDDRLIGMWQESPVRSTDDPEDGTLYEVECLTPDELAERINDGGFAYAEDYVRFIDVGGLQPGME